MNSKRETAREREHRHDRELAAAYHRRRRAADGQGYKFKTPRKAAV